jgi:hypothetical protein
MFSLSRLWDALADPVVGFLTDRTRSRFGPRPHASRRSCARGPTRARPAGARA